MAGSRRVTGVMIFLIATTLRSSAFLSRETVKFLLMVSGDNNSSVVSAVDQTLEVINNDYFFLPNHRLEYILSENQVQNNQSSICYDSC